MVHQRAAADRCDYGVPVRVSLAPVRRDSGCFGVRLDPANTRSGRRLGTVARLWLVPSVEQPSSHGTAPDVYAVRDCRLAGNDGRTRPVFSSARRECCPQCLGPTSLGPPERRLPTTLHDRKIAPANRRMKPSASRQLWHHPGIRAPRPMRGRWPDQTTALAREPGRGYNVVT